MPNAECLRGGMKTKEKAEERKRRTRRRELQKIFGLKSKNSLEQLFECPLGTHVTFSSSRYFSNGLAVRQTSLTFTCRFRCFFLPEYLFLHTFQVFTEKRRRPDVSLFIGYRIFDNSFVLKKLNTNNGSCSD
jgi:hypothetical protein